MVVGGKASRCFSKEHHSFGVELTVRFRVYKHGFINVVVSEKAGVLSKIALARRRRRKSSNREALRGLVPGKILHAMPAQF